MLYGCAHLAKNRHTIFLLKIFRIEVKNGGQGVSKFTVGPMTPNKNGPAKLAHQKIRVIKSLYFLLQPQIWDKIDEELDSVMGYICKI